MDSLSTQKAKPRKMKVVVKKSRVQILLDLFYRVVEITVVMVTVAKLCYQLVIMFEDSGLTRFLINRHLAFLLGNAIVITIVAKCGLFANQEPDARRNSNDFYDEFVRESSRREHSLQTDVTCREKQSEAKQSSEDKRQSRAKQSMLENRAKQSIEDKREKQIKTEKQSSGEEKETKDITVKRQRQIISQKQESPRKSYERSGSEKLEGSKKRSCGRLKRSETERPADGTDSDDELRYKIESFIARQRRNQKDEEFCIV
ncbi:unnamed protein product [Thlaspi arvense]|uniref:Uncharacterized protein n=1 Tax=Thlaspi arvense TaxID=13288 RepID=A0AAU9SF42_THLAR|nr:unnamed protein product [Thlaspi arvense]